MKSSTTQSGFTLIELLVSLSLFIIIVMALVGSLYTVNDASRKVQAMRTVMDNLNFAMESMSRTIRTSEAITIDCSGGGQECWLGDSPAYAIHMNSTLGDKEFVEYRWDHTAGKNGSIQKKSTPLDAGGNKLPGGTEWQSITSPEIDIQKAGFYGKGLQMGDGMQPAVVLSIQGTATVKNTQIPFSVQTFLSQRTPEL